MGISSFKGGCTVCEMPFKVTDGSLPAWRKTLSGAGIAL
jgi:hypothetical protein